TAMFACARIASWSAHRFEELITGQRIIRPAYRPTKLNKKYLPIDRR
ncbi:MAG: citrate synthase, partial [Oscillospiraceae bacterium]|nr:citrate synthase [Oscillospiraceae bacterium]